MRMNQRRQTLILTLSLALLGGCSSTLRQAPVIDRALPTPTPAARPSTGPAAEEAPKEDVRGPTYTVKKGDTLIQIALNHGQNYRDLAAWNNLANPDDIKVDQVLRVAPPEHVA